MKKWISSILIIAGIGLIGAQFVPDLLIKDRAKKSVEIVEEITVEQIEENNKKEGVYDYTAIEDIDPTSAIMNTYKFEGENVIGQLIIEELGIDLPILKGVTEPNMLAGAGTMMPDVKMGEGNYPLASHYRKDPKLLFGNLLNAQEGMQVRITDKVNVYEYQIYETILVPETAIYMIEEKQAEERGKPIISLMTCYFTSKNGKRFFALGELVDSYPYRMKNMEKRVGVQ
jgi:sortase A